MDNEPVVTLPLYCASIEQEVKFRRLSDPVIKKLIEHRDEVVFFSEYARLVIYAALGTELADEIWGGTTYPKQGGLHAMHELYWIASIINPEISWAYRQKGKTQPKAEPQKAKEIQKPLRERLPVIEKFIRDNVVGQDEAVETILDVLYRAAAGLADPDRPQAVLLFTGPSGSGKTHLARTLAVALFDPSPSPEKIANPQAFFRIDCTLYQQSFTISNLIGSPQGYIGSDLGSPLPEFLSQNPKGNIILIDEAEKAHPALHKIFMGLFDYGKIKDNKQQEVEANNTIFIMTSNAGSREASTEIRKADQPYGFGTPKGDHTKLVEKAYKKKLEEVFPPEFRGRVDETVVFNDLDANAYSRILDLELRKMEKRLAVRGVSIKLERDARKIILDNACSPELGARRLSHYMRDNVVKPLSRAIVDTTERRFVCRHLNGKFVVEPAPEPPDKGQDLKRPNRKKGTAPKSNDEAGS